MPRYLFWSNRLTSLLKQTFCLVLNIPNLKVLAFLAIVGFSFFLWLQHQNPSIQYRYDTADDIDTADVIQNIDRNPQYAEIYRKKTRLLKDLKYILLWTDPEYYPFYALGKGQRAFIDNNCPMINCYVTSDRYFFGNILNIINFHAIAFNGRNLNGDLPQVRTPTQKYILFNTESADYYPIHQDLYKDFFNWTSTYRLDSDIIFNYIVIKDKNGRVIGPKEKMEWLENMDEVDSDMIKKLGNKTEAVAWFVSNCETKSKREQFVSNLQKELQKFNLTVDVYGDCGPLKCPRYKSECTALLQRHYYFYLSLENSFAKDYVTEKLLTALDHDVVPIVYGAANYSRFVPPGSYINARDQSAKALAALVHKLISHPKMYQRYFRWKKYYSYESASPYNFCNVCLALNNRTKYEETSVYHDIKGWWNVQESS